MVRTAPRWIILSFALGIFIYSKLLKCEEPNLSKKNPASSRLSFKEKCLKGKGVACLNVGILLERDNKIKESKVYYKKGCDLSDGGSCSNLGYLLQQEKQIKEAKRFYQKSCSLREGYGCYNLACLYSLEANFNQAKKFLRLGINFGYKDWGQIESDRDLAPLRNTKDFKEFYNKLKTFSLKGL